MTVRSIGGDRRPRPSGHYERTYPDVNKEEIYERVELDITPFDAEDVITTSGESNEPPIPDPHELMI